jgi:glycosidase
VYRELIALRKQNLRLLADGKLNWLLTDDKRGLLVYDRVLADQRAIVAFNISDIPHEFSVPADGRYRIAFSGRATVATVGGKLSAQLPAQTGKVWIQE